MEIIHKPWEWTTETTNGGYSLVKAGNKLKKI